MRTIVCAIAMLSFGIVRVASADPVTLTSGAIWTWWDASSTTVNVAGSGFAAVGSSTGGGYGFTFNAGDTVALTDSLVVNSSGTLTPNGSVTMGGQSQLGFFRETFQFTATPFVAGLEDGSDVSFSTPFTGQGLVQLFSSPNDTQPFTSEDFVGSGTLSFGARQVDPGVYAAGAGGGVLNLAFDPAGSATPEPASMLLLGAGLAAWQLRRRRVRG